MKKKRKSSGVFGSVVAAVCIIIYVFAVIYAIVRIYFSIEERKSTAEREFSNIATAALTAGMQGFMNEQFINTINRTLEANKSIEALIISGPDGEYAFERQQGYAVTLVNNSPRFKNRLSFSSINYYRPLPLQDLRNANIRAVAGAFDYDEISTILKQTLLIILTGFAVAFFTMLLQLLIGGKTDEKPAPAAQPVPIIPPAPQEKFTEVKKPVESMPPIQKLQPLQPPAQPEQPLQPAQPIQPIHFDLDDVNIVLDEPVKRSAIAEDNFEPKGLYSQRSNIGWEEYTKDRLDSEIHRCSSTEKDLTLALIDFMDITNDSMYKQAAEEAISFFSSRDLLFEYGKHGITVILPGIDLDTGILKSEKFYQRIQDKFPNRKSQSSLCIGLSSRAGRLINADRLMMESQEALLKANHDNKSSIIAFKSDPEKYRAFIASQSLPHL